MARERKLLPFNGDAVARIIEQCSRLVEDQNKTDDPLRRRGRPRGRGLVLGPRTRAAPGPESSSKRADVQKAIDEKLYRSSQIDEKVREMITDGIILVDTRGAVVGQVNGLSVSGVGDHMFGRPSRITATHRLGSGEVVDIEREVDMGGPIHSKGVLILAGYLGSKYAQDRPMSLTARLVFEQSYSGVEGDSASSAELYALLSSLSGVPIQQRFAVTGSVNQRGQVQAIGGVNEKIEGFFAVCEAMGLKGDESVLIPKTNVRHLMLSEKVQKAVEKGKFHIYPVTTIDEGISLLTGRPAGELNAKGEYPAGSINRLVVERLTALNEKALEAGGAMTTTRRPRHLASPLPRSRPSRARRAPAQRSFDRNRSGAAGTSSRPPRMSHF